MRLIKLLGYEKNRIYGHVPTSISRSSPFRTLPIHPGLAPHRCKGSFVWELGKYCQKHVMLGRIRSTTGGRTISSSQDVVGKHCNRNKSFEHFLWDVVGTWLWIFADKYLHGCALCWCWCCRRRCCWILFFLNKNLLAMLLFRCSSTLLW